MGLYTALHVVRFAVAQLLVSPVHRRKKYSLEDVAVALNVSANLNAHEDITRHLDVPLLVRAFSNGGLKEYSLRYKDAFGETDDKNILFVSLPTQTGSNSGGTRTATNAYVGCFPSEEIARSVDVSRLNIGLREEDLVNLVEFTRKLSKKQTGSKKKRKRVEESEESINEQLGHELECVEKARADLAKALAAAKKTRAKLRVLQKRDAPQDGSEQAF